MTTTSAKTFCRYCHAYCPMQVTLENGRALAVHPDRDNVLYGGYTCIKGRQLIEQMYQDERLRQPVRREGSEWGALSTTQAMDEIATRIKDIIAQHGPRAIATYNGTYAFQNSAQLAYSRAWHDALGSPSFYTSVTIDQPAKVFVGTRHGYWGAGGHFFCDSDVALVLGNNPLVSQYAPPGGVPSVSPFEQLRDARKRGLKLIVVDPRSTELSRRADLHLQIRPGTDAVLLAGMIRFILGHGLHDHDFCDRYTSGIKELQHAVEPFLPEYVAARCDIPAIQIEQAAIMFASGPRGSAVTGTGPEMSPHPNLSQHLVACLNTLCGRYYRAGETLPNPGMLAPPMPRRAEPLDVPLAWGNGARSRIRPELGELTALGMMGAVREMPTALLADEILTPGEGQVRALLCIGGNPLLAWPNQRKTLEALQSLDLLVCVDPYLSATARLAHYVIAPKMTLERDDVTLLADPWYEKPYSQYAQALVEAGRGLMEEWEVYWELGQRLGLEPQIGNTRFAGEAKPDKFSVLQAITAGSRLSLGWLREHPGGHVFSDVREVVQAAEAGNTARLKLHPSDIDEEYAALLAPSVIDPLYTHTLICARSKYVLNSSGLNLGMLRDKMGTTNPAMLHPLDMEALSLREDSLIDIHSEHGRIAGVVRANPHIKRGVVAMHHGWGAAPGEDSALRVREVGANTNALIDNLINSQRYTGMAQQSAIPVYITAREEIA